MILTKQTRGCICSWETNEVNTKMELEGCSRGHVPWGCGPLGWAGGPWLALTHIHCLVLPASFRWGSLLRGTSLHHPTPPTFPTPVVHPLNEPSLQLLEAFPITRW